MKRRRTEENLELCAESLAAKYKVQVSVAERYVSDNSMKKFYSSFDVCSESENMEQDLNDVWNSFGYYFKTKTYCKKFTLHGLAYPTVEEIQSVSSLIGFLQLRLIRSTTDVMMFSDLLSYVKAHVSSTATDACILLALYICNLHDDVSWREGNSLDDLIIRAQFIDNPKVFTSAVSTHPAVKHASDAWIQRLCSVAYVAYVVLNRKPEWLCQFSGMHTHLDAVFRYYRQLTRSKTETKQTMEHVFSNTHSKDITDASYSEIRSACREWRDDFSWMYVAAYLMSHQTVESRLRATKELGQFDTWKLVPIPTVVVDDTHLRGETTIPALVKDCLDVTSKPETFTALHWSLFNDATRQISVKKLGAFYKNVEFERTKFAPADETEYMIRVGSVDLHGVFDVMDSKMMDDDALFIAASIFMNLEINSVYMFSDCEPREVLRVTLQESLASLSTTLCTQTLDMSFLTHASTSLWWWLFERVSCPVTKRVMALVCEYSARYPEFEQLGLWAAFVRLCGKFELPEFPCPSPTNDASPVGKLIGISARNKIPVVDPLGDDIGPANDAFREVEETLRASASLSSPDAYGDFGNFSFISQMNAIIQRLLLRGNWKDPRTADCLFRILSNRNKALSDTVTIGGGSTPPSLFAPHMDEGAALPLFEATLKLVDATAKMPVQVSNAVLHFSSPAQLVQTTILKYSSRVRFE